MTEMYIIENVEARYPKIDTTYIWRDNPDPKKKGRSEPCDPSETGAEYSIQFRMDNATAKKLFMAMSETYQANRQQKWAEKLANPFIKDDDGTFIGKAAIKGKYKNGLTVPPMQLDSQGNKLASDFQLTTGSTVNVAVQFNPYDGFGGQSVNLWVKAVQVIKLVPRKDHNPFGTVDGGFTIEDANPFAKPVEKSNVVTLPVDDFDEVVEEPKKVVNKSAPPPTSAGDDLSSVLEAWDD